MKKSQSSTMVRLLFLAAVTLLNSPLFAGDAKAGSEAFANAAFNGINDDPVQLADGRWDGEPYVEGGVSRPSVGLVGDFLLTGDLDGDGEDESVVLLWQSSGGSGTFDYIAVMRGAGDEAINAGTAALGDRVQIRRAEISNGAIYLDVIQQGEDDAACCPGQRVMRSWVLDESGLVEMDSEYRGDLSASTIEGDDWVLTGLGQEQPVSGGVPVTLQAHQGQISGNRGCNRCSAAIENGAVPGDIRIGPVMGTRMACPEEQMLVEQTFLARLSQVTNFRFRAGKLVLSGLVDGEPFSMTFVADPAP
jgi:heat shock protein HslJ